MNNEKSEKDIIIENLLENLRVGAAYFSKIKNPSILDVKLREFCSRGYTVITQCLLQDIYKKSYRE